MLIHCPSCNAEYDCEPDSRNGSLGFRVALVPESY